MWTIFLYLYAYLIRTSESYEIFNLLLISAPLLCYSDTSRLTSCFKFHQVFQLCVFDDELSVQKKWQFDMICNSSPTFPAQGCYIFLSGGFWGLDWSEVSLVEREFLM